MRSATIALCSLLAVSRAADANPRTKAEAKQLYDQGLRHYNVAEYAEAITVWKRAYLIAKRPLLLFNIGQAYRLSGDCEQALRFYASYLRDEPNPKNQDEVDAAEALCRAKVQAAAEPAPPPPAPVATPLLPAEGAEPPAERTPPPPRSAMRTASFVAGVTGLALGGTALYFALDARSQANALEGYTGEWGAAQMDIERRGERDVKLAWGLGIAGGAAIGAAITLFVLGTGERAATPAVTITPLPGGAHASWGHAF